MTTDTVLPAAKPDRTALYAVYKKARYNTDRHASPSLLPQSVLAIKYEIDRVRDGREAKYEAEKKALNLDFDYASNIKPYGGYVSDLTLDADAVRALGFDPEHLTAKVIASYDDFFDTAEDQAKNCGFDVEKCAQGDYRWELKHEDGDRPTHESVKVNYAGYRDRPNYVWVTADAKETGWFAGNAWRGMSKGVKALVRHQVLRASAKSMASYMRKWVNDDIKNFHVEVTVYWRDEEVGGASLGGFEVESRSSVKERDDFADAILGNDLVGEALDKAAKWADAAVKNSREEAAKIVNDIALLPQRSIDAVRNEYTTATVLAAKRA